MVVCCSVCLLLWRQLTIELSELCTMGYSVPLRRCCEKDYGLSQSYDLLLQGVLLGRSAVAEDIGKAPRKAGVRAGVPRVQLKAEAEA